MHCPRSRAFAAFWRGTARPKGSAILFERPALTNGKREEALFTISGACARGRGKERRPRVPRGVAWLAGSSKDRVDRGSRRERELPPAPGNKDKLTGPSRKVLIAFGRRISRVLRRPSPPSLPSLRRAPFLRSLFPAWSTARSLASCFLFSVRRSVGARATKFDLVSTKRRRNRNGTSDTEGRFGTANHPQS